MTSSGSFWTQKDNVVDLKEKLDKVNEMEGQVVEITNIEVLDFYSRDGAIDILFEDDDGNMLSIYLEVEDWLPQFLKRNAFKEMKKYIKNHKDEVEEALEEIKEIDRVVENDKKYD